MWKVTETSPKSEGFQFGIEDIFLNFGALLPRRRTTHYRLGHDARRTSSQSASARSNVIIFHIVKQNREKEIFFVVLLPVRTIFTFFLAFLGFS